MTPRLKPRVDKTPMSGLTLSHVARPTAAPQDRYFTPKTPGQSFDRIVRNEEVTGSNPVSSTESPRQGRATLLRGVSNALAGDSPAPQRFHSPAGDSNHEHLSKRGAPRVDPNVLGKPEVGPVS